MLLKSKYVELTEQELKDTEGGFVSDRNLPSLSRKFLMPRLVRKSKVVSHKKAPL